MADNLATLRQQVNELRGDVDHLLLVVDGNERAEVEGMLSKVKAIEKLIDILGGYESAKESFERWRQVDMTIKALTLAVALLGITSLPQLLSFVFAALRVFMPLWSK